MTSEERHLSDEELRLVRALEHLRKNWPKGYTLASMGGSLCLFRTEDMMTDERPGLEAVDPAKVLWETTTIPNTGGDW